MSSADGTGEQEQVGSVGEEAAKLIGALADWAREHGGDLGHGVADAAAGAASAAAAGAAGAASAVDEHLATGAPECTYCPICRGVHLLRECAPEVRDHLASAAASLMQAAAGLLAAASTPPRGERTSPSQRADGVERIDLDDLDDGEPFGFPQGGPS
ncbi:hypothetical protein QE364_001759 [Nocardioides zeae]|uniref:Uncharacterized protein n=2 Tax=Nocardioides zeae TaxID=1457234 RepID=A0ACC6IHT1_9ACTN|nr:hypothetical protein [Nocardioides zeae]MDQ1103222.1 hypothetical protein [Nocardioides zeae]MDR6173059.1 hypothetical protein [Nocardioides zeae]MDR6210052.1 hypothetical protein [Nocardioides zeae]